MAFNFSNVNISSQLDYNTTLINFTNSDTPRLIYQNANDLTNGWFMIIIFIVLYIILLYQLIEPEGRFRYDFARANLITSFIILILSGTTMILGLSEIRPFAISGIIIMLSIVYTYFAKERGL